MNRPTDIPEDVWEMARELLGEPDDYQRAARPKAIERIARAILAERGRAAWAAETAAAWAGSAAAATGGAGAYRTHLVNALVNSHVEV